MWLCESECRCPFRTEYSPAFHGAGVRINCEPQIVATGFHTGSTAIEVCPFDHLESSIHPNTPPFSLLIMYFYFTYMNVLPGCIFVHRVSPYCSWRQEEGVRSPGNRATHGCVFACRRWEQAQELCKSSKMLASL